MRRILNVTRSIYGVRTRAAALAAAVALISLAGCRNGPAVAFSLDLQQGPRLQVGFSAVPSTNAPPTPHSALR
jgi:hypothetical protein